MIVLVLADQRLVFFCVCLVVADEFAPSRKSVKREEGAFSKQSPAAVPETENRILIAADSFSPQSFPAIALHRNFLYGGPPTRAPDSDLRSKPVPAAGRLRLGLPVMYRTGRLQPTSIGPQLVGFNGSVDGQDDGPRGFLPVHCSCRQRRVRTCVLDLS